MGVRLLLLGVSGVMLVATLAMVFLWVPTDEVLGLSQRIFYFHVPIAMVSLIAIVVVMVGSVGYLRTSGEGWDGLAYSAAEVGFFFCTMALLSGMVWAKPVWGVWWTWSPQLTLTLVLWFIYVAYLMLRAYAPKGAQGSRYAAVLGIIGFVDAPLVYMSAKWWRDVHPEAVVGPLAKEGSLEGAMQVAFMFGILTFVVLFSYLVSERYSLRRQQETVERLRYGNV